MASDPESKKSRVGEGIAIGVAIGVALGAALDNVGVGIAIGVAIGAGIGSSWDRKGRKEGRRYLRLSVPILDVQFVGPVADDIRPGLAQRVAEATGRALDSRPQGTWVKLRFLDE